MKQLLVAALFIVVIITIYSGTIGGSEGTKAELTGSGERISESIQSIDP
jgi:hypothetical protein